MNSENLKYVIRQFVERKLPVSRPRELILPIGTGKVVGLAGVRRSGKTFLFFDAIHRLTEQGVDRRRIVYLNFEDDRLHPIRAEELDLVLRCLHELYPEMLDQRVFMFLDEVQNVSGWERWVRRIHDTQDIEVYVTGSSSQLLTRDLATSLRGRSITLEVFPFADVLPRRGRAIWRAKREVDARTAATRFPQHRRSDQHQQVAPGLRVSRIQHLKEHTV